MSQTASAAPIGLRGLLGKIVSRFYPVYFILVMSTGIVSLAALQQGFPRVAQALFVFNLAAYALICLLTLARTSFAARAMLHDLLDATRGFGFLTAVAATCVLGVQLLGVTGRLDWAIALWGVALLLWLGLLYTFFAVLIVREHKPGLDKDIHGGWLIAVVATQSLAVLGAMIAPNAGSWRGEAQFFTLCLYLLGAMMYLVIIPMIFQRLIFFTLTPVALRPLNWIDMGASAISSLAGATIEGSHYVGPLHTELTPFLKVSALFFWVAASWWIPLLVILGVWRHLYKRYPLSYDLQYWGMVFPIGMYSAATSQLAAVLQLHFLALVPRVAFYIALAAWLLVFVGMLRGMALAVWRALHEAPKTVAGLDEAGKL